MRRLAVLGGTLDPVHLGHVGILEQVVPAIEAEEGWLMPAADPSHREPPLAGAEERLAMAEAAVEGRPGLRAVDIELRRGRPTRTIDTLAELAALRPDAEPWLVLGADAAAGIGTWHRAAEVLARGRFAVVNRSGEPAVSSDDLDRWGFHPGRVRLLHVRSPAIHSADVRRRLARGEPIDDLVPPGVARLIRDRHLYGAS